MARPFDSATSVAIPHGQWGIVHYGVMMPNLSEPFRFFDAVVVLGTARVPIFGERSLATGDPDNTAWILTGSAVTPNDFEQYSITGQCDLSPDGTHLRFDDPPTKQPPTRYTVGGWGPRSTGRPQWRPLSPRPR